MSGTEQLRAWLDHVQPLGRAQPVKEPKSALQVDAQTWLGLLLPGPPCYLVEQARDTGLKGLVTGQRHEVVLKTKGGRPATSGWCCATCCAGCAPGAATLWWTSRCARSWRPPTCNSRQCTPP